MQIHKMLKKIVFSLFLLCSFHGSSAAGSDIINDYEANINQAFIKNFEPSDEIKPVKVTVSAKLKTRNKRYSINFDKVLIGYRGDRFVAYEHHLSLFYEKDSLYIHTKGLTIDHMQMPEYLLLAKVDQYGALTWSDDFEAEFSLRTYRYKLSDRLVALIWGVWAKNADYPKFQLNGRHSSLTMTDLPCD